MNPSPGSLAELQAAFMAQVLDEDAPAPTGWGASQASGMQVYRGNYRSALVEALRSTFEKTERWVGEDAFAQAAAHHVIANPPTSWTLDQAGAGFDRTCAELFARDPDVAELAWLEWAMLEAFIAHDATPLAVQEFAELTSTFTEQDWTSLQIEFLPGVSARKVAFDLRLIWQALAEDELVRPDAALAAPQSVIVWRENERGTFMMGAAEDAEALNALQAGASYGELCMLLAGDEPDAGAVEDAAMRAGGMLARWLTEGLIARIRA